MNDDSITIVIELCRVCGGEMEIDRHDTTACGTDMAYVTAVCANCGERVVINIVTWKLGQKHG